MKVNNLTVFIWAIFMAIVLFFSSLAHFGILAEWLASVGFAAIITLFVGITFLVEAFAIRRHFWDWDFSFRGKEAFPKLFTVFFGVIAIFLAVIILFSNFYTLPEGFNWLLGLYHGLAIPLVLWNLYN